MIERDVTNTKLMNDANIFANISIKIKNEEHIVLAKTEHICVAFHVTLNDIFELSNYLLYNFEDEPKEL